MTEKLSTIDIVQTLNRNPKEQDVFVQAFTSIHFKRRVKAGLKRIEEMGAESGFSIAADEKVIYYSPLAYGSSDAGSIEEINMGLTPETPTGDYELAKALKRKNREKKQQTKYSFLGKFHFHPISNFASFSEYDLTYQETFMQNLTYPFLPESNVFDGVFLTTEKPRKETVLFMYQGTPTPALDQGHNTDNMDYQRQAELFEQTGIKTIIAPIPCYKGVVDLKPLKEALIQRNTSQ